MIPKFATLISDPLTAAQRLISSQCSLDLLQDSED